MPTISVPQSLLKHLLERDGHPHDAAQINDQLPLLGTDIDTCDDDTLNIEIFPDRPDLLSGETLAFAMANFLHNAPAQTDMPTEPSGITVHVDASVEHIRPVVHGAVVKGVILPDDAEEIDAFIKGLMDHQEKLHFALGRGRQRVSIGAVSYTHLTLPTKRIV